MFKHFNVLGKNVQRSGKNVYCLVILDLVWVSSVQTESSWKSGVNLRC